ncbi:MAG TPA: IclR family transcriptional regulator [Actinomycetota bacterium]|jgi:DNA-binding IclR family transcriptional regulator
MRDQHESGGNLQSVRRALRALELISEHGELGVTELGRKLDVHKATASRLIATLAERGFVERDPISEKYRLGFGLISLAGAAVGGNDLVRAARPILDDLAERTHETVNLGVLSGESVVYIDQVTGTRSIVSVSWVGQRTPLHCTSNGKVLLAYATDAERERMLSTPLTRLTPRTITDLRKLRAQLAEVRARGYAQTLEELEEGLNAVAAPVRGMSGDVIAALSVSGPAFRMRAVDLPRFGKLTADAALAVSRRLGYVDRGVRAG